ncbi:MAG: helix-turn-helix transcriptional regulator [Eubacteriales bacterium]|nr:helix-turn-helix transcriptional regulator [Eubacteriales bacterium]
MNSIEPISHIKELCAERNWSYYQLAKSSGLSYSTVSTLLNNTNLPSLTTLEKICSGFGISIAEFFDPGHDTCGLSQEQQKCLQLFNALPDSKKELAIAFMKGLLGTL